jgi:hypothetical protein
MDDKELKILKSVLKLGSSNQNHVCCCGCNNTILSISTINRIRNKPKYLILKVSASYVIEAKELPAYAVYGINSRKMMIIGYSLDYPKMDEINMVIKAIKAREKEDGSICTGYHAYK